MQFEWDPDKAQRNFDPNAVDDYDEAHSSSEIRYNLIGMSSRRLLFIVYSEPQPNSVRIISARKAERKHQRIYAQEE